MENAIKGQGGVKMVWGALLKDLFIGVVAAGLALAGNYFIQQRTRKEVFREKVFDKQQEIYSDLVNEIYKLIYSHGLAKDINQFALAKAALLPIYFKLLLYGDKAIRKKVLAFLDYGREHYDPKQDFTPLADLGMDIINHARKNLYVEELLDAEEMAKIINK